MAATSLWKFVKNIVHFFWDLESPWKPNRALNVLEFDGRGCW